jgi:EAL domain-containing protein (putative c-di-GMP-specific phosphodiesterase class I)
VSNERGQGDARPVLPSILPVKEMAATEATGEVPALARGTLPNALVDQSETQTQLRELEGKLERCLATLVMNFQPIVHAGTRARFGYEALLRSTDKSLPHPGAILDAAERLERIPMLGRAVRAQTAKVIAGSPAERGVVFINLHLLDLFDKQLTSAFAPLSRVAGRARRPARSAIPRGRAARARVPDRDR